MGFLLEYVVFRCLIATEIFVVLPTMIALFCLNPYQQREKQKKLSEKETNSDNYLSTSLRLSLRPFLLWLSS